MDVGTTQFPILVKPPRKGFIYRAAVGGRRLYFSENEIKDVFPSVGCFTVVLHNGARYQVRSSVPDEAINETPSRPSVKGDLYYHRS